jgi:hypothetical protein
MVSAVGVEAERHATFLQRRHGGRIVFGLPD